MIGTGQPGDQIEYNALLALGSTDVYAAGSWFTGGAGYGPLIIHWDGSAWSIATETGGGIRSEGTGGSVSLLFATVARNSSGVSSGGPQDFSAQYSIIAANGSVQHIPEIPQNLKDLYKTAWEISQKVIIDMAADRGAYICQSQSLNIFMENVNFAKLTSMHFYSWKAGLKTGMYYLRTKAATDAIKFTVDKAKLAEPSSAKVKEGEKVREAALMASSVISEEAQAQIACSLDNPEGCEMCSG